MLVKFKNNRALDFVGFPWFATVMALSLVSGNRSSIGLAIVLGLLIRFIIERRYRELVSV